MGNLHRKSLRNNTIGKIGEEIASLYISKKGYRIITRNYRARRYGELDIVAIHKGILIFIEVKTRCGDQFGTPEEAIGFYKLKELRFMADYFRMMHPETPDRMRIDAIAITLKSDETLETLRHIENITQ
jgi:putative endonuclease